LVKRKGWSAISNLRLFWLVICVLREAFRQSQDKIPPGFDYLLMISPQWSKKKDKACSELAPGGRAEGSAESKKAVMQGPRAASFLRSKKGGGTQPTFEQVKASFLALVNDALGKEGTPRKTWG